MSDAQTDNGRHVSVVIPARNCACDLPECLDAVSAQTFGGPLEVIVAVAPSSDGTDRVASEASCKWPLQIVENPAGTTSSGLNLAIGAAAGDVIVRVDAQARLPPDYVERAVVTLARTGAANVGGVQRPVGQRGLSRVIAATVSSRFGGGPAAFRHGSHEGPADTVYLGVFDPAVLASVGGFDESLERNQDYELNWRLREQGHVVWLDPSLVVDYQPRTSWAGLVRQYYDYGVWKRVVISRHPRSTQPRQLAAPALVVGLVLSALELVRGRLRGGILPGAYLSACALAAARLGPRLPALADRLRGTAAFAVMHLSWGAGFLVGRRSRARSSPTESTGPQDAPGT
ncbi:glycosyltransferase family 2 protein [Candidatus Poriferisodalis sp.]|uniref:glycosyltransferase family 2 protein n=1 Tax=Candidatus Poriferisodalis sp. TaxID=3101277 RepID=UPI003B5C15FA